MMHRLRTALLIAITLAALVNVLPAQAAPAAPAAASSPQPRSGGQPVSPQTALDCTTSPFGGALTLGSEKEAFVGYAGGFLSSQQSWLLNDRYDLNGTKQLSRQDFWPSVGQQSAAELHNIAEPVSVALDTNGDGKDELAQVFGDANSELKVGLFSNSGATFTDLRRSQRQKIAVATGNLTRRKDEARRLVIASQSSTSGALTVMIPPMNGDGTFADPNNSGGAPIWITQQNNRKDAKSVSVAVGDLNGDGFKDEIVVAISDGTGAIQLIVLKYDLTVTANGDVNTTYSDRIREIATTTLGVGTPSELKVAVGDVDARYQSEDLQNYTDEIVVAADSYDPDSPGLSGSLGLYTLGMRDITDVDGKIVNRVIEEHGRWNTSAFHSDLNLTTGDTDGDGRAEPIVAYRAYSDGNPLVIQTFDAERPTITLHNTLTNFANNRNGVGSLALAAGDMNRDGFADIVAAFRDSGNQLQVIHATDQVTATTDLVNGIQLRSAVRDNTAGRNGAYAISATLGDYDGDSLKAVYAPAYGDDIKCKPVEEPNLAAVIYPPPYWQRLQGNRQRNASLGQSTTSGASSETNLTTATSHSATVSAGIEVGGELGPIELSASLKATGGYAYKATKSTGGGSETQTTLAQRFESNDGAFVVIQRAHHDCYTYQLRQAGVTLDAAARFCEDRGHDTVGPNLANWDTDYGPARNANALQWSPIGRDWSGLALFRSTAQSSTAGSASADRAVDGDTGDLSAAHSTYATTHARLADGSVSSTQVEANPWWQVDLGHVQNLTALRIWHRYNYDCGATTCAKQLGSFTVFVSDSDLRTISNDPAVLKNDARVRSYSFANAAPRVTNIQTLDNVGGALQPIHGRYVRVQLDGTGALDLAEVQAFGDKHIDPDQYPIWVRDSDAKVTQVADPNDGNKLKSKYTAGSDGYFEVGVHAPDGTVKPVRMRGNLKWNSGGALQSSQSVVKITKSDVVFGWSMNQQRKDFLTDSDSIEHTVSVGAEFEAKGGIGAKVVVGGSYEYSTGILKANTNSVSWGTGIDIGGGIQGFPETLNGQTLPFDQLRHCEYGFQPFYYEAAEESSSGYQHRFMMTDSVVSDSSLDRSADLSICQQPVSTTPTLESNVATGAPGSSFVLTASGFTANSRATLALKGPGEASYRTLTQLTMGANGQLVFVLVTRPGDSVGGYSVQLSVDQATRAAHTQVVALTANITLSASAALQTSVPPNAPSVGTDAQVVYARKVFLPLSVR